MRKLITVFIIMLLIAAGCFAEDKIEIFGNTAVVYNTECTWDDGTSEEEVIDHIKYELNKDGYGCKERTLFGVFLTRDDIELYSHFGVLNKAMVLANKYKAEQKTNVQKAVYRAEELALHGYWNVALYADPNNNGGWVLWGWILFKGTESAEANAVKYFTLYQKILNKQN